ncbi:hypothetical protein BGZ81_008732 [Podila clonocystis]|nr:hypothetical protein BGZ81_008732 [Podila clonocystis]
MSKSTASRPQLSFLPLVEDTGTTRPIPQPSLQKTLPLIEKKVAAEAATAAAAAAMNPAAGAGAVTAIQDAVTLANWINTLQSTSPDELDTIFKNYKEERYPVAKASFEISRFLRDVMGKVAVEEDNAESCGKSESSVFFNVGTGHRNGETAEQQSLYQTQRILEQQAASNPIHVAVV